ncbi:unnamed protein product [Amoebophrya sp. A120]|nr:unnamed protein product [Amoebophrya sp. A120]|eukprot:GSA120T00023063001.1
MSDEKEPVTREFSPAPRGSASEASPTAADKASPATEAKTTQDEDASATPTTSSADKGADTPSAGAAAASSSAPAPQPVIKPFVPHTEMPEMTGPVKVVYCPEDGMPPEYCQYGGKWDLAKPWVLANFPQLYPELAGESLADAKETANQKKAEAEEKAKTKELPGGKKTRSASPKISIKVASRQGRKKTTTVIGLDTYDVKLEAAAKIFKKKFACGSAAVKGNPGQPDSVEIQGEPGKEELVKLLCKEFSQIEKKKIDYSD